MATTLSVAIFLFMVAILMVTVFFLMVATLIVAIFLYICDFKWLCFFYGCDLNCCNFLYSCDFKWLRFFLMVAIYQWTESRLLIYNLNALIVGVHPTGPGHCCSLTFFPLDCSAVVPLTLPLCTQSRSVWCESLVRSALIHPLLIDALACCIVLMIGPLQFIHPPLWVDYLPSN
jgi:hypothetical protein